MRKPLRGIELLSLMLLALAAPGCRRAPPAPAPQTILPSTPESKREVVHTPPAATPQASPPKAAAMQFGVIAVQPAWATWYAVPPNSLAERRAPGELTAAHDHLPLGAYVRVINPANERETIVRITDRGVRRKDAIDLCKAAALEIGLVGKGRLKVRLEVLEPRQNGSDPGAGSRAAAPP